MNRAVTTLDAIVEGTPYWFLAPLVRANNLLLTIFFQLFSVDHVVSILHVKKVMIAVLHLCLKTEDSKSKDLSDSHAPCCASLTSSQSTEAMERERKRER